MISDRELISKLMVLKQKQGVTFTHFAKLIGVTSQALYLLRTGYPVAISEKKKEELLTHLDESLKK